LRSSSKLKIITRLVDKSNSLKIEYRASLTKVGIHLVSLQELQKISFSIFMWVDDFNTKEKAKGALPWPTFISNIINKFLDVLTENFLNNSPLVVMLITKLKWHQIQHCLLSCLIDLTKPNFKNSKIKSMISWNGVTFGQVSHFMELQFYLWIKRMVSCACA